MDAGKPFITKAGEVTAPSNKSNFLVFCHNCGEGSAANCILLESDCLYLEKTLADFMPATQKLTFVKQTSLCYSGPREPQYGIIALAAKLCW